MSKEEVSQPFLVGKSFALRLDKTKFRKGDYIKVVLVHREEQA